jgi:hypothetical protein
VRFELDNRITLRACRILEFLTEAKQAICLANPFQHVPRDDITITDPLVGSLPSSSGTPQVVG